MSVYTDIADEIYGPSKGQVPGGVKLFTARSGPITLTRVQITRQGLARPAGRYSTLEMPSFRVSPTHTGAVTARSPSPWVTRI